MAQLEPLAAEFHRDGAQLAYIAAEKRGGMFKPEAFLQKNPVSFPFLLDEDRAVTKRFGLYHRIGLDAFNIAHPATLVIDAGKMIVLSEVWLYKLGTGEKFKGVLDPFVL